MPVFNAEKFLAASIESILNQNYQYFELIIVDDCSTDNSYKISKYFKELDNRIKLIKNEKNYKQAYSRNQAIQLSKGKYIAFIDADDIACQNRIKTQLTFMESNNEIDVCGSFYHLINNNNFKIKQEVPILHSEIECQMRIFGNCIAFSSVMIKTNIIKQFIFNEEMCGNAEDYELWMRMLNSGIKFHNIPEYLLYYQIHQSQSSQLNLKPIYNYVNSVRKKNLVLLFPHKTYKEIEDDLFTMMNSKLNIRIFKYYILLKQIYSANETLHIFNNQILKITLKKTSIIKKLTLKLSYVFLNITDKK